MGAQPYHRVGAAEGEGLGRRRRTWLEQEQEITEAARLCTHAEGEARCPQIELACLIEEEAGRSGPAALPRLRADRGGATTAGAMDGDGERKSGEVV